MRDVMSSRAIDVHRHMGIPSMDGDEPQSELPSFADTVGQGSRLAIRSDWDIFTDDDGSRYRLEAVAWVQVSAIALAENYGEVVIVDGMFCTNNRRRPILDICIVGPDGQNIIIIHAILPNEKISTFLWCFFEAFPELLGRTVCKKAQLWLMDCDIWAVTALESGLGPGREYPNAKLRLCGFHAITLNVRKMKGMVSDKVCKDAIDQVEKLSWNILGAKSRSAYMKGLDDMNGLLAPLRGRHATFDRESSDFLSSLRTHAERLDDFRFVG